MADYRNCEVVSGNLDRLRRGKLLLPAWCTFGGSEDYCWSWVAGYKVRREDCAECPFCLGGHWAVEWAPPMMQPGEEAGDMAETDEEEGRPGGPETASGSNDQRSQEEEGRSGDRRSQDEEVIVGTSKYHRAVYADGWRFAACDRERPRRLSIGMSRRAAERLGMRPCGKCWPEG